MRKRSRKHTEVSGPGGAKGCGVQTSSYIVAIVFSQVVFFVRFHVENVVASEALWGEDLCVLRFGDSLDRLEWLVYFVCSLKPHSTNGSLARQQRYVMLAPIGNWLAGGRFVKTCLSCCRMV